jgi:hypothetical protein
MRRIIDGKAYNTETATLIGEASSHLGRSDFGWWEEALYRTRNGRFFLHGRGNARSSWAQPAGQNSYGPGSGIRALSEADAMEWAEKYLPAAEYEAVWTPEEA